MVMDKIRMANAADARSVLEIYTPYIEHTSYTFEIEVPSVDAFAQRILTYTESWPWLIYEVDGKTAGYAYATKHRERVAYQWCVESSIYIHDDFMHRGIGSRLYIALLAILAKQGVRNVYAVINLPNDASVNFHEKHGFRWFADYKNAGYKLGKWKTVGWWQKKLNEYSDDPHPPQKMSELDTADVSAFLNI